MRRKSKSGTPSLNGDDESALSKSSKKSFLGKLTKRKDKKSKSSKRTLGGNENSTVIPQNTTAQKEAEVQKAFLDNGSSQSVAKPYMLKIALLLVDAKTRRFELLQLEFDSDKALVSDALSQIPIHVTEKVLSSQTYMGVCGANGSERKRTVPLFDFCRGNDVLVAIPAGTSSDECARLAKPILSDEKVIGMLSTSGINADPWTNAPLPAPRAASRGRQVPRTTATNKKSGSSSTLIFYALVVALIVAAVAFFWFRTTSSESLADSDDITEMAGGEEDTSSWTTPSVSVPKLSVPKISVPKLPSINGDQVWTNCHAACDASRDFMEKYVGGASATEAESVDVESPEL